LSRNLGTVQTTAGQVSRLRPRPRRELGLIVLLYVGYSLARMVADADLGTAVVNADALLDLEGMLGLDVERAANEALMSVPGLALASSYWYSLLHYVVTPAVLFWVYRSHSGRYRRVRNALVTGTAIGLVGFVVVPMAPPRMLPGYVDTLAATSEHGWWGGQASAPRGLGSLTNQLAAMPSLHVGWALWCAWVVLLCTRVTWLRLAAVAYAVGTTVVVVATANHYVLDAVAGAAVIAVGVAAVRPQRLTRRVRSRGTGAVPDALTVACRADVERAA
jgi:PAP2 superfamily